MRIPCQKAKSTEIIKDAIDATIKLWRKFHLSYDQTRYVAKETRNALSLKRVKARKRVVQRLSREEEDRLISQAYCDKSEHGLLIKTLFQTGTRVSEFVAIKVEDFYFEELMILIEKGKGGKSRYVPILPALAQELKTHLDNRKTSYLFESNRSLPFSPRRIQQIVKTTAEKAGITKNVYPHLLRHTVATFLLEKGMSLEQIQKFLGHSRLETTQIYAESTTEMIKASYQKAFSD